MSDTVKIGAAYIRVSDERQDEYSPDSQLKKIREYASKESCIIPDEYVFYDDGISGKSVKKRGDFNRMIAMAKDKSHPFDVIYVWKFSRFARNQEESMVYKNLLRKKDVSVVSVSEPIPEGHYGTLIERIIEWMDEFYLINLSTEVVRGMTEKVTRGEPVVPPPYGYIMKDGEYIPDEESGAADIIREIFDRYISGEPTRAMAATFHERGISIDNRRIEYIINNPCYIGKLRWSADGSRSVSHRHFDNENILTIDAHHKPIVTIEQWEAAHKRQADIKKAYPKYARKNQNTEYMLKGMVRCSACGATLVRTAPTSKKSQIHSLQCHNYARGSCNVSHSITIPKITDAIISALETAVTTGQFTIAPQKPKAKQKDDIDYDKLIAIEERKLARAKEAYLAEIDTLEQYKHNKVTIEKKIEEYMTYAAKQNAPMKINLDAYTRKVTQIIELIKSESATEQEKNEALRTIIDRIIYEKPKNNLAIYFHE